MTLRVVVRAAVAVVVFEGGLLLNVCELRHTSRAVVGLVSFGLLDNDGARRGCSRTRCSAGRGS